MTPIAAFATELAGSSSFYSPGEAESRAGFRVLRVYSAKFPVTKGANDGLVETFPEIGLPRVYQTLVVPGHTKTLDFLQEPDRYRWPGNAGSSDEVTFGRFAGILSKWHDDQICFRFPSGESLEGSAIMASVRSVGGGYSVDDIRRFVEALSFGS